MADVYDVRDRTSEFFKLYRIEQPAPKFGESPEGYQRRVIHTAQCFLPAGDPWREQVIARQPDSALPAIERAIVQEGIARFKAPVGKLREVVERGRGGSERVLFYGDPEYTWAPFKGPIRRAVFTNGVGRGADSPTARAASAARAAALKAAGL